METLIKIISIEELKSLYKQIGDEIYIRETSIEKQLQYQMIEFDKELTARLQTIRKVQESFKDRLERLRTQQKDCIKQTIEESINKIKQQNKK